MQKSPRHRPDIVGQRSSPPGERRRLLPRQLGKEWEWDVMPATHSDGDLIPRGGTMTRSGVGVRCLRLRHFHRGTAARRPGPASFVRSTRRRYQRSDRDLGLSSAIRALFPREAAIEEVCPTSSSLTGRYVPRRTRPVPAFQPAAIDVLGRTAVHRAAQHAIKWLMRRSLRRRNRSSSSPPSLAGIPGRHRSGQSPAGLECAVVTPCWSTARPDNGGRRC